MKDEEGTYVQPFECGVRMRRGEKENSFKPVRYEVREKNSHKTFIILK